jgi:hypothetical protein
MRTRAELTGASRPPPLRPRRQALVDSIKRPYGHGALWGPLSSPTLGFRIHCIRKSLPLSRYDWRTIGAPERQGTFGFLRTDLVAGHSRQPG